MPRAIGKVEQLPMKVALGSWGNLIVRRSPVLAWSRANHRANADDVGEWPVHGLPRHVHRARRVLGDGDNIVC